MEIKEFKTYEMNPPLKDMNAYVIFDDYQSAEIFDTKLKEQPKEYQDFCSWFIPVYLTNQRWKQVTDDYNIYPEEFKDGIKIIIPNPRRNEGQERTQDRITWNRYLEFRNVWDMAYLGYFTEFGCTNTYKPTGMNQCQTEKAKQFEKDAWESYKKESDLFKSLNGFNWAYLEKFKPGIIKKRIIEDCFDIQIGFTTDLWSV